MKVLLLLAFVALALALPTFRFSTQLPDDALKTPVFSNVLGQNDPYYGPPPTRYYDYCGWDCAGQDGAFLRDSFSPQYCDIACRAFRAGDRPDRQCIDPVGATGTACQQWGINGRAWYGPFCHSSCVVSRSPDVGPKGIFNLRHESRYQVRWGEPALDDEMSGFGFNPQDNKILPIGTEFLLGRMVHYNHPIYNPALNFTLTLILRIWEEANPNTILARQPYTFNFGIDETPNRLVQRSCASNTSIDPRMFCPYPSALGPVVCDTWSRPAANYPECPDMITASNLVNSNVSFSLFGVEYTLVLTGFRGGLSTATSPQALSEEKGTTLLDLFGIVTQACPKCTLTQQAPIYNETTGRCECICTNAPCTPPLIRSADCTTCVCPPQMCPAPSTPVLDNGVCKCACTNVVTCGANEMAPPAVIPPQTCGPCVCKPNVCSNGALTNASNACSCICDITKCPQYSGDPRFLRMDSNCNCTCARSCTSREQRVGACNCECIAKSCPTSSGTTQFAYDAQTCDCTCPLSRLRTSCAAQNRVPNYAPFDFTKVPPTGSCECGPCLANFVANLSTDPCVCTKTAADCAPTPPVVSTFSTWNATACECQCDLSKVTCATGFKVNTGRCGCEPVLVEECLDVVRMPEKCRQLNRNFTAVPGNCSCTECLDFFVPPAGMPDVTKSCVCPASHTNATCASFYNSTLITRFIYADSTRCQCLCDTRAAAATCPSGTCVDLTPTGCGCTNDNSCACPVNVTLSDRTKLCADLNRTFISATCDCGPCIPGLEEVRNATGTTPPNRTQCDCPAASCGPMCKRNALSCRCEPDAVAEQTCVAPNVVKNCSCVPCVGSECDVVCAAVQANCTGVQAYYVPPPVCQCLQCPQSPTNNTCKNQEVFNPAGCNCTCPQQITCGACALPNRGTCGCTNLSASCFCGDGIVDPFQGEQCDSPNDPCCDPNTCRWKTVRESCSADPCMKPGTCIPNATGGRTCSQTQPQCDTRQCNSNATCTVVGNSYQCSYAPNPDFSSCGNPGKTLCDERCVGGQCIPTPITCDVASLTHPCKGPCCSFQCNATSGQCETRWFENETCSDLNICTQDDSCRPNLLGGAEKLVCRGDIQCTNANNSQGFAPRSCFNLTCNAVGRCEQTITAGASCTAESPCLENTTCTELGECTGPSKPCGNFTCIVSRCAEFDDPRNNRTAGQCYNSTEAADRSFCDDQNNCTSGDQCGNGTCVPGNDVCANESGPPLWPIGVAAGVAGLAAAIAAFLVCQKMQAANLADPVTWGEFAGGDFGQNPLYDDPVHAMENPIFG